MARSRCTFYLVLILLFLAQHADAQGQTSTEEYSLPYLAGPLDAKEIAKAKRGTAGFDLQKLKKAKLDTARKEYESREGQFLVGRGTLDFLLAASRRLLESEIAVATKKNDLLAAWESYCQRAKAAELINEMRYESGRIPIQDYLRSKYDRLDGEIKLATARGKSQGPVGGEQLPSEFDLNQALVKAKFDAFDVDTRKLAGDRLNVAQEIYHAYFLEFLSGRGTLDQVVGASRLWLDAELAVNDQESDRVAAFERHWIIAEASERIDKVRYEKGRIPIQDVADATVARLAAGIWLTKQRAKKGKLTASSKAVAGFLDLPEFIDLKELAKSKMETSKISIKELVKAKVEAAQVTYQAQQKEFLGGKGTLDYLLHASRRWLESELDLLDKQPDKAAALERPWLRTKLIEDVNRYRYSKGRIPITDYLESRYFRLEAEVWLAAARQVK